MREKVSEETYRLVMEKYDGRCQRPGCGIRSTEYSHIIFRSESRKWIDDPGNGIPLCPKHHRLGKDSVHRAKWWRFYYYRFLPDYIRKECSEWHLNFCINNECPS